MTTALQAERAERIPNRARTADGAARTVERGQHTISGRLHLVTAEPIQLRPDERIVGSRGGSARDGPGQSAKVPGRCYSLATTASSWFFDPIIPSV